MVITISYVYGCVEFFDFEVSILNEMRHDFISPEIKFWIKFSL